jgi:hypothetical protein
MGMTHVYLNENVIKDALKSRAITAREANELTHALKRIKAQSSKRRQERVAS